MGDNKLDITSTAVEKGIDLVKGFLDKLIGAPIEEYGLLMADNVKLRRFKNQLNMVAKAQKMVEESGINIKQISIKTLVPLLEYSSLEDDETLQQLWSNLLVNYIDVNQKLESSIFPFILSQLSSEEIGVIENLYNRRGTRTSGIFSSRMQIDGVIKSNLIRLGIAEIIIVKDKKENGFAVRMFDVDNTKIKITQLGIIFYESCTVKNKDI